jgi:hypothetical protein
MNFEPILMLVVAGLVVLAVIWWLARYFSTEAKLERRRRRSNARIASKTRRPSIKFSVRTKKD